MKDYKINKFELQREDSSTKLISLIELDKADYELDTYQEPEKAYQSRAEKREEMDKSLTVDLSRKKDYVSSKQDVSQINQTDEQKSVTAKSESSKYAKMAEDKFGDVVKSDTNSLEYN